MSPGGSTHKPIHRYTEHCELFGIAKMHTLVVSLVALSVAYIVSATPVSVQDYHYPEHQEQEPKKPQIPILKQNFEQHHEGYQYSYETGNGIHVQEQGYIKNKGDKKHETLVQQGSITYHDEHGHPITLTYVADEHGFQPQGAHLPTPPPVPAEIAKSLEESAHHQQYQEAAPEEHQLEYQQHQPPQYDQY